MAVELHIGGEAIQLEPTAEAVEEVVLCAYALGGFCLVMELQKQLAEWKDTQSVKERSVLSARDSIRKYQRSLSSLDEALKPTSQRMERINSEMRDADRISELMRQSWADVAEAEEALLADYENAAVEEFGALIDEALEIAKAEWDKYAPYDLSDPQKSTVDIAAKNLDPSKLRLKNRWPELLHSIFQLKAAARKWSEAQKSLHDYRDVNYTTRNKPTQNPYDVLKAAESWTSWTRKQFEEKRASVGKDFPIALQVYGRLKDISSFDESFPDKARDRDIEKWVIESLLEVWNNAPRMRDQANALIVFRPGITVRQVPGDVKAELALYSHKDGKPPGGQLPGEWEEARILAQGLGFVVPASYAVAYRLLDGHMASRSVWLQLPVRHRLSERALGRSSESGVRLEEDPSLAPYFEPGRLHHAALEDVYDAVQDIREAVRKEQERWLLIMDAIAFTTAFFTAGESILLAGAIHAIVRGAEMHAGMDRFIASKELAGLSFSVVEECIWRPPSTLKLASDLLECGFDIASDVVGGRIGNVLNAIQVVMAMGYGLEAVERMATSGKPS